MDIRSRSRKAVKGIEKHAKNILESLQSTIGDVVLGTGLENGVSRIWEKWSNDLSNRKANFHRIVIDYGLEKIGVIRAT